MPLTEHHPTYVVAAVVAVLAALVLQMSGLPAPWPAAIAFYVFGAVAWTVIRERVPSLQPTVYAGAWVSVSLLVIAYETLGAAAGW